MSKEIESKNEKKVKRSISWSHLLLPSYNTRLTEFHKIFAKTVPQNERLIADFICALQKEILIQGRLYVSVNYLSFHANIFGWQTVLNVKLCDIIAITKANTIRLIPNAIQVVTSDGKKCVFRSFVARDKAFRHIYKLWQDVVVGQKMSVAERWELIHYNYGNNLGISSDSEEDEDQLDAITRDNMNLVEEEIDDEVFDESVDTCQGKRCDSNISFTTCPESQLEDVSNRLTTDANSAHIFKVFKNLFTTIINSSRESLYLTIVLVLSLLLLSTHFVVLFKLSNVDTNASHVYMDQLRQLADLTTRMVSQTDRLKVKSL